jgi:hypothetical protein
VKTTESLFFWGDGVVLSVDAQSAPAIHYQRKGSDSILGSEKH